MASGTCTECNKEYKNLGAHRCKGKQQEDTHEDINNISTEPIINMPVIEQMNAYVDTKTI